MAYHLEGRLLEVCDCRVLCPCWIGEDPDNGTCDTIVAYHFDQGVIDGVDVTNRTLAIVAHLPGNILKGNWRVAVYIDDKASDQQMDALLKVYTGKLGGPIADIAKLVGEVVAVEALSWGDRHDYHAHRHDLLHSAGRPRVRRKIASLHLKATGAWNRRRSEGSQRPAKHVRIRRLTFASI